MATSTITEEEQLKRFLYLGGYDNKFTTGNVEKYSFFADKNTLITDFVKKSPCDFLKLITTVNEDKLPRRETLLFALAVALNCNIDDIKPHDKHEICAAVHKVCKSDDEFFTFIKYYTHLTSRKTKVPTTVKKAIVQFYKNKTAMELADSFVKAKSYHTWKHKDLLKLAHYKPENNLKDFVVKSIMFDLKNFNTEEKYEDEKQKVADVLQKITDLRHTSDEKEAVPLILELHACFRQINSCLNKSPEVWAAIVEESPTRTVLHNLPKFYKMGYLKSSSPVHPKVIESLTNVEKIKACNLHPIEVFIYLKDFEKGGKPKDPKLIEYLKTKVNTEKSTEKPAEAAADKPDDKGDAKPKGKSEKNDAGTSSHQEPKCTVVISSINKCLGMAYKNVKPTGKRIMITIDASDKGKTPCLHNRNITCLEAAVAITMYFHKTEKDVIVATFNEANIELLTIEKGNTFTQVCQKISQNVKPWYLPFSGIKWAQENKKNIDLFINFIHNPYFMGEVPKEIRAQHEYQLTPLKDYRKKMNLPNTKLATICLSSVKSAFSHNTTSNAIDLAGFSAETVLVLEAFCRGSFN